jgi:hypothetical protein
MLIPIILFLLGLPSRGPSLTAGGPDIEVNHTDEATQAATLTALGGDMWSQLGLLGKATAEQSVGEARPVDFKQLEGMALDPSERAFWQGKTIRVKGQYLPRSERFFMLVRLKVQCCVGDATQLNVPMISKDAITGIKAEQWVEVTGRVDIRQFQGKHVTAVLVSSRNHVKPCPPDLNPYVQ